MKTILFAFCLMAIGSSFAQNNATNPVLTLPRKNVIFFEPFCGGGGVYGTLNYTRVLFRKSYFFVDTKIGLGFGNVSLAPSINIGGKGHYLHLGGGGTFGYYTPTIGWTTGSNGGSGQNQSKFVVYPNIGYKFHPSQKHFYAGLYYTQVNVNQYFPGGHGGAIYGRSTVHQFALGLGYAFF